MHWPTNALAGSVPMCCNSAHQLAIGPQQGAATRGRKKLKTR
jgi:hypothetical protein